MESSLAIKRAKKPPCYFVGNKKDSVYLTTLFEMAASLDAIQVKVPLDMYVDGETDSMYLSKLMSSGPSLSYLTILDSTWPCGFPKALISVSLLACPGLARPPITPRCVSRVYFPNRFMIRTSRAGYLKRST